MWRANGMQPDRSPSGQPRESGVSSIAERDLDDAAIRRELSVIMARGDANAVLQHSVLPSPVIRAQIRGLRQLSRISPSLASPSGIAAVGVATALVFCAAVGALAADELRDMSPEHPDEQPVAQANNPEHMQPVAATPAGKLRRAEPATMSVAVNRASDQLALPRTVTGSHRQTDPLEAKLIIGSASVALNVDEGLSLSVILRAQDDPAVVRLVAETGKHTAPDNGTTGSPLVTLDALGLVNVQIF
jgi:hypothetical protein